MKKLILSVMALGFTISCFAQKSDSTKAATITIRGIQPSKRTEPLIVIDGNKQFIRGTEAIKGLNQNEIESLSVLKDSSAISLYGIDGQDGVLVIKTKKGSSNFKASTLSQGSTELPQFTGMKIRTKSGATSFFNNTSTTKTPMYILDGVEVKDISLIKPDNIESITILKDSSATTKYGAGAANGVIIISTKKTKESPKKN